MKKAIQNVLHAPDSSPRDNIDSSKLSEVPAPFVNTCLHDLTQDDCVSHFFTLHPDIDTLSLLAHACETLTSINVMSANLARDLESSHRKVTLAIQQLTVLVELLVNRALDNLDPPGGLAESPSFGAR